MGTFSQGFSQLELQEEGGNDDTKVAEDVDLMAEVEESKLEKAKDATSVQQVCHIMCLFLLSGYCYCLLTDFFTTSV